MPSLAGDLAGVGDVFAGLAAIVIVVLRGASAGRMRAVVWLLNAHGFSNRSGRASAPAQQVNDQNHECDDKQQMNQASGDVENKAQKPQNQENRYNRSSQPHVFTSDKVRNTQ
jgi:hypothetical protein